MLISGFCACSNPSCFVRLLSWFGAVVEDGSINANLDLISPECSVMFITMKIKLKFQHNPEEQDLS